MTSSTHLATTHGARALSEKLASLQLPVRAALLAVLVSLAPSPAMTQSVESWPIHSMDRPRPPRVTPGASQLPALPPSDAIVLFDGKSMSEWQADDSAKGPARWRVSRGEMVVVPGAGGVATKQAFGDVQLHIEWASPTPPRGSGQDRGNSGVFLMGRYEVQILDSYENTTYADGQAAALYGQYPPLVDVTRPPGEWQSYDIVFRRPRFRQDGAVTSPARLTVFHNGVLVQDNVDLTGPTANKARPPYSAHPDELPIGLQDHDHPVRFRNIWLRKLSPPSTEQ